MIKSTIAATILVSLALGGSRSVPAFAQHEGHSDKHASAVGAAPGEKMMSGDHAMMAHEPHHVLAMAYHQNLGAFAHALEEQTARGGSVDLEFTRTAVTEMRRSFGQMTQHREAHMKTMSVEMRASMDTMMPQMEMHHAELNNQLSSLEREVNSSTPSAKNISAGAIGVTTHLDAMTHMHHGELQNKMHMNKKM